MAFVSSEQFNENGQMILDQEEPGKIEASQWVGTKLGYEILGLGGYPETYIPSNLAGLIESGVIEFEQLNRVLSKESARYYEVEMSLLESGLPKASDAENYFVPKYAKKTEEGFSEITTEEAINMFDSGDISELIFVQDKFREPEDIDKALNNINTELEKILEEIAELRENPLIKYLNIPEIGDGKRLELNYRDKYKIQRLVILDLHQRNLRDIARTFYMYQMMTKGCVWPRSMDNAREIEDSEEKKRQRRIAEGVSKEIYGDLSEELWRESLYKYLESYRVDNLEVNEMIDRLEDELLSDMSEDEKVKSLEQVILMKNKKEKEKREESDKRIYRFGEAITRVDPDGNFSHSEIKDIFSKAIEGTDLSAGELEKIISEYIEERFQNCNDIKNVEETLEFKLKDVVDKDGISKVISYLEENGVGIDISLQDVADILSVSEKDMNEIASMENFEERMKEFDLVRHSRRNSMQMARFMKGMLNDMGIPTEIVFDGQERKIEDGEERKFRIVLSKNKSVNVSTTEFNIRIPVSRSFSVRELSELFGHEIMAHIGGAERIRQTAPGLINTFGGSGANEGFAVAMETVISEFMKNKSLEEINLTDEGENSIDALYRKKKAEEYNSDPDNLNTPLDGGLKHIIALGLHLGFGKGEKRSLKEVFDLMKRMYMVENIFNGENESVAKNNARKSAFNIGILRQARGLWDQVTYKNMSYSIGDLIISNIMKSGDLASSSYGKVGPDHDLYLRALGLNSGSLDSNWGKIRKESLFRHLGLSI